MNRLLAAFVVTCLVILMVFASLCASATMPSDSVVLYLKTAKVTLKKQVRDPTTGSIKEVLIGRYFSAYEAKEAMRLLPKLTGGLLYRIDVPPAYGNVIECVVPTNASSGICPDLIDYRLHFVP